MNALNVITFLLDFLVKRLRATSDKLQAKAEQDKRSIDALIARRMTTMEASGKANGLANNISKFI